MVNLCVSMSLGWGPWCQYVIESESLVLESNYVQTPGVSISLLWQPLVSKTLCWDPRC